METDRYGLRLATSSGQAAAAYRVGLDLLLSAYTGAEGRLLEATGHDAGFALAHAARARHLQIHGRIGEAREAIARARSLVAGASPREQAHVRILGLAIDGQAGRTLDALVPHLQAHPRDALLFSLALGAFGLYAFSGRADHDAARLALCTRMAPHYGDDWWFLTHLGWSHTEAGKLTAGGRITERALELRRENAHAAHAYAHFFAEAGEGEDGTAFVESWLPGYDPGGALYGHIHWHRALWRLERNDIEGALEIYRDILHPEVNQAPPINVISDSASLLWRISLKEDTAMEWRAVHDYGRQRFAAPAPHFIEWHLAMAAAGAREFEHLERRLQSLPESPAGAVLPKVCAAFTAFGSRRYREVIDLVEPITQELVRLGGSGAQRQVFLDMLDAARARQAP